VGYGQSREEEGEWPLLDEGKARRVEGTIGRSSFKLFVLSGGVVEGGATIAACLLGEVSGFFPQFVRLIDWLDGHGRFVHVMKMMNHA